ncbi:hypothetical protein AVEN_191221-1, partial [Araneus ventricosus]
ADLDFDEEAVDMGCEYQQMKLSVQQTLEKNG